MKIALITTDAAYLATDNDEELGFVNEAINASGLSCEPVVWHEPREWSAYDAAVLKSPWDYHLRLGEFSQWFQVLEGVTRILNPAPVVWWNLDKRYLSQFVDYGVNCVKTTFCAGVGTCVDALARAEGQRVVVKPSISNGSRYTGMFLAEDPQAIALCREILAQDKVVMIQPAIPEVAERGERGLLYFNGEFSHAITKGPILKLGGGYLGGQYIENISSVQPSQEELELGASALAAIRLVALEQGWGEDAETLLYARIDVVTPEGQPPMLLEAELFEPSLFLRTSPGAVDRFTRALHAKLA